MNVHIESEKLKTGASASFIMNFLANLENHARLMPEQIINLKALGNSLSYTIKGTADLSLVIKEQTADKLIFEPQGKAPFPFLFTWNVSDNGSEREINAVLDADMNMFIKMVAEGPLRNFLNHQTRELKSIADAEGN